MRNQPRRQGTTAILMVFNRPTYSMAKPANKAPIGTTSTNTLAARIQQTTRELSDRGLAGAEVPTAVNIPALILWIQGRIVRQEFMEVPEKTTRPIYTVDE
jgi:hypothetical protein